jgi:uncharacterized protein (TIGR02646 family)
VIAIERKAAPEALQGKAAADALEAAGEFFRSRVRASRQQLYDFDLVELLEHLEVVFALQSTFSDRCAFCGIDEATAEELAAHRLRPPQDAVASDGSTSRRHYWWLAYAWKNLYLACSDCRKAQGAKFPVERQRARVGTTEGLDKELPLLLDPCRDDPEGFLIYLDSGEVVSREQRGKATIETFDLNRPLLVEQRRQMVQRVKRESATTFVALEMGRYEDFLESFLELYAVDRDSFAALRRQFFNQRVQVRPRQVETALVRASAGEVRLEATVGDLTRVSDRVKREAADVFFGVAEPSSEASVIHLKKPDRAKLMRLHTDSTARTALSLRTPLEEDRWSYLAAAELRAVEIENFRAIERLDLQLNTGSSAGSWLMLLGENGAGKTSVLQAIALALSDSDTIDRLDVDPAKLLRQGASEGFVRIWLSGSRQERELRFGRGIEGLQVSGRPEEGVLVAGYGATRLLPRDSAPAPSEDARIAGLFDPHFPLARAAAWLPTLSTEQFDIVARALKRLLALGADQELERTSRGIELVDGKDRHGLAELSDGYKAMSALVLDIMQLFLQRWGSPEAAEGIVLVDELGAHLHPTWQMRVTGSLRETFPRVQFIATTHDPLCLRGLHDGEVAVLRRRENHIYALHEELPPVEGLAVDQLLTSEHFGLNSSLDPDVEALFQEYYDLLAQRRRSAEEERTLAGLSERLAGLQLLGSTRRERLALEAADEAMAAERQARSAADISDLRDSTKLRVNETWREISAR